MGGNTPSVIARARGGSQFATEQREGAERTASGGRPDPDHWGGDAPKYKTPSPTVLFSRRGHLDNTGKTELLRTNQPQAHGTAKEY